MHQTSGIARFYVAYFHENQEAEINIVSVRGLKKHDSESTWECCEKSKLENLRERNPLLEQFPGAQILDFRYETCPTGSSPLYGIDWAADSLLSEMELRLLPPLSNTLQKPIILVCYSYGGLVAKEALQLAKYKEHTSLIAARIYGTIFLGTPHSTFEGEEHPGMSTRKYLENLRNDLLMKMLDSSLNKSQIFHNFPVGYKMVRVCTEKTINCTATSTLHSDCLGNAVLEDRNHELHYTLAENCSPSSLGEHVDHLIACIARAALKAYRYRSILKKNEQALRRMYDRQRHPGTCEWLFRHSHYLAWLNTSDLACLWIYGLAGAGKTILISSILDNLEHRMSRDCMIISFFSNEGGGQADSARDLLAIISYELARYQKQPVSLPDYTPSSMSPSQFRKHIKALLSTIPLDRQVFIIFDGIDVDEWIRCTLVEEVADANLDRRASFPIKCCISSRTAFNTAIESETVTSVNITNESGLYTDILRYAEVKAAVLATNHTSHGSCAEALTKQLCSYANGMFLWVALVMESVQSLDSLSSLLQEVRSVPSHVESLYRTALQKIPSSDLPTAQRIFSLLVAAYRPLEVSELFALVTGEFQRSKAMGGILSGSTHMPKPLETVMTGSCGLLLLVTEEGLIRFRHSSVRNYLLSRHGSDPPMCSVPAAHDTIAHSCLAALNSGTETRQLVIGSYLRPTKSMLGVCFSTVLEYASTYWCVHFEQAEKYSTTLTGSLQRLINVALGNVFQTYTANTTASRIKVMKENGLRVCASYGIKSLTQIYLGMGTDPSTRSCTLCETPLHLAAAGGHTETAALLMANGASVHSQTAPRGNTPLYVAAAHGFADTVKLFLDHGADPNFVTPTSGRTALHIAAANGSVEVMKVLVEAGAEASIASSTTKETPLHLAAERGHVNAIRLLLDYASGSLHETELYRYISQQPYFQTWSEDLLREPRIEKQYHWGSSARRLAERDLEKLTSYAMTTSGLNACTHDGRTPLHYAASNGHEGVVRLLLERGADPEGGKDSAHTALRAAAENGHLAVVKLLMHWSFNLATKKRNLRIVIKNASCNGHQDVADMLLWHTFASEIEATSLPKSALSALSSGSQRPKDCAGYPAADYC